MKDFLRRTDSYQSLVEILSNIYKTAVHQTDSLTQLEQFPTLDDGMTYSDNPNNLALNVPWLRGLHGASVAYLLSSLASDFPNTSFLVVLPSHQEAEKIVQDIPAYGFEDALFFPEWQNFFYEGISPTKEIVAERMTCLGQLLDGRCTTIVTSIKALMHRIAPKSVLSAFFETLRVGDETAPDEIVALLLRGGYQRVSLVEVKGEFARRGDILDVYPLIADNPIRIDFWGDKIDAIRTFDLSSQRSIADLQSVVLSPMREVILTPDALTLWKARAEELVETNPSPKYRNVIHEITQRLEDGTDLEGVESLLPMLYPNPSLLTDYLSTSTIIILVEPAWVIREGKRTIDQAKALCERKLEQDRFIAPSNETFAPFESVITALQRYPLIRTSLARPEPASGERIVEIDFGMRPPGVHRGNIQMVMDQVKEWMDEGYLVNIFCDNSAGANRLREILAGRNLLTAQTAVEIGSISEGFLNKEHKFVVISDDAVFDRENRRRRRTDFKEGTPILNLIDLKEGDYVVHVSHGIAIYAGIRRLDIDGKPQDFLVLKYAGGDILYVPTHQIDLVQKYIGGDDEGKGPRLDKLGGTSWQQAKSRVKASIEQMAEELLQLCAIREAQEGYVFSPDTPWHREFEAMFPYEETPDQLQAIEEVKEDMERSRPMDRLICGDVGYGKTEVALRAVFKAVMDGKQAAVLVPTTVLALQHFNTFQKRFESFPVSVEMLTRFRVNKEAKMVKVGLEKGTVDIVIGTHSLLSDSLKFHDLGLLVIDEEHRFGVKHKEKIKQIKQVIDVITLTATPIPRTLHMSLIGIRDFSVINTPPENRLPIETYVMEYNPDVVRDAILCEMERGGQVFFVHNRVQSIASIATAVQNLVPQARVSVAHGQMSERQLEKVMIDFVNHKSDVLVCTMIIESGLDIPNVNTILINRADALGLAQLYQLRGRVGRARYQAYGYLFYPQGRAITEHAQKRLRVIEEFTDLGSGFKIALRDLEIRGTGNILGHQQHGHIAAVGYDMYCKLLEETVRKLKGEKIEEPVETRISLPVEAYLPNEYVPDSRQKVSLYKKIAALKTEANRKSLSEEIVDRYGKIPEPVEMLLEIAELKQLCQTLGVDSIISGGDNVKIALDDTKSKIDPSKLVQVIQGDRRLSLSPPGRLMVNTKGLIGKPLLLVLRRILVRAFS